MLSFCPQLETIRTTFTCVDHDSAEMLAIVAPVPSITQLKLGHFSSRSLLLISDKFPNLSVIQFADVEVYERPSSVDAVVEFFSANPQLTHLSHVECLLGRFYHTTSQARVLHALLSLPKLQSFHAKEPRFFFPSHLDSLSPFLSSLSIPGSHVTIMPLYRAFERLTRLDCEMIPSYFALRTMSVVHPFSQLQAMVLTLCLDPGLCSNMAQFTWTSLLKLGLSIAKEVPNSMLTRLALTMPVLTTLSIRAEFRILCCLVGVRQDCFPDLPPVLPHLTHITAICLDKPSQQDATEFGNRIPFLHSFSLVAIILNCPEFFRPTKSPNHTRLGNLRRLTLHGEMSTPMWEYLLVSALPKLRFLSVNTATTCRPPFSNRSTVLDLLARACPNVDSIDIGDRPPFGKWKSVLLNHSLWPKLRLIRIYYDHFHLIKLWRPLATIVSVYPLENEDYM